ncbi:MAG: type II secretion system F family protein [Fuerstiella sp.]|nr:type II secretion system F family protein [Fuerstiella sp.]
MPNFAFTARDEAGQTRTGAIDAATASIVASQLRTRGWIVIRLEEQLAAAVGSRRDLFKNILGPRSVQVELSLRQLSVMLRGGISLLSAMQTLSTQADSRAIRRAYSSLIDTVQSGRQFSDAIESENGFPDFLAQLVRVGEQTGIQETVLVRAADMMRTRRETIREFATALLYPLLVLLSAFMATGFIVTSLLPKLAELLVSLNRPLPAMTQSLIAISGFTTEWSWYIFGSMVMAAIAFVLTWLYPPGRLWIERLSFRIPVIGKLFRISGTLTFSQTMGVLVSSGVTVLEALITVQEMHSSTYFASIVQKSRDAIIRGQSLADTLRVRGAYMPLLATMVAVGEESGNLDEVLDQVSEFHRTQLSAMIKTLSALVTPAIIVVVGSIVGYVYIAFFVGLFSVAG